MQTFVSTALNSKRRTTTGRLTLTHFGNDSQSNQSILLKTLHFPSDPDFPSLVHFTDFVKSLKSPHVVRTLAYETYPKDLIFKLALERLDMSLADLIAEEATCPFSPETVEKSLMGIVGVLKEAQSKGIAHRQITAEHCFSAGKDFGLKIGNFLLHKGDRLAALREIPKRYTSLEARKWLETGEPKEGYNAYKADVYSLGVVFLQIMLWDPLDSLDARVKDASALLERAVEGWPNLARKVGVMLREETTRPDFEGLLREWEEPMLCVHCFQIVGKELDGKELCCEGCRLGGKRDVPKPAPRPQCVVLPSPVSPPSSTCQSCGRGLKLSSEVPLRLCLTCQNAPKSSRSKAPSPPPQPCSRPSIPVFEPFPNPSGQRDEEVNSEKCIFCVNRVVDFTWIERGEKRYPGWRETMAKVCSLECFERGIEAVRTDNGEARPAEPRGMGVAGAEGGREGTKAVCKICFTEFIVYSPAPHPAHTSEVVDFCSPECKAIWINQEQEWDFGRTIPDDCQFCMQCAMVPVRPVPLPCNSERHVFCSMQCVGEFVRKEMEINEGDLTRFACPYCGVRVPGEVLEAWGVGQGPERQAAFMRIHLPASTCNHCRSPGPLRALACYHTLCPQCHSQSIQSGCPLCPRPSRIPV